ncbi:MAG: response regulator [Chloroflexota bacterium]
MILSDQITILLVEDDEGHALLVEMNLREAGLDNPIDRVGDGQAALDYVGQRVDMEQPRPLLVLLDLNLPVVDGYGVLRQLKSNPKTHRIPIIVLTSTEDSREIERCYELGCNVFLTKPVEYSAFVTAVKQLGLFLSVIQLPSTNQSIT